MPSEPRPRVRLLHHLARSGGTVISRCLASMYNVVLLSEIHPLGVRRFDPLQQAHQWYGLVSDDELQRARRSPLSFGAAIGLIERRCAESGRVLVLRDWSHLDYTGFPFVRPAFRPLLAEALTADFDLVRTSTVRHPLDSWLSLSTKPAFEGRLRPEPYFEGLARFADEARRTGFCRYEDFTRDPDAVLAALCDALEIGFDPGYRDRWATYANVTGDVMRGRAGARITPLPRLQAPPGQLQRIADLPAYRRALLELGYDG